MARDLALTQLSLVSAAASAEQHAIFTPPVTLPRCHSTGWNHRRIPTSLGGLGTLCEVLRILGRLKVTGAERGPLLVLLCKL